jgi:hypothetical protein
MNKNMNTNIKSSKKPFCKVCQDAGKSESDYTSHFVKSDKGVVICPTLLAITCRYCNKQGHTIKFCPTLEQNKKEEKKHAFKNQKEENQILEGYKARDLRHMNPKQWKLFSEYMSQVDPDTFAL